MISDNLRMTRDIIRDPEGFLKSIKDEHGIRKPLRFLTLFTFVVFIFLTYYYLDQINMILEEMAGMLGTTPVTVPVNMQTYVIAYLSFVVLYVVIAFLRYYIIHFFAWLFGAKHRYDQSYKALTYSLAPEYISTPIFVALVALLPMMVFQRTTALVAVFVILLIPYLVVFFYTIYLRILALARLQDIAMWKSLVSIYVLGFIGQVAVLAVLELILIFATATVMNFL